MKLGHMSNDNIVKLICFIFTIQVFYILGQPEKLLLNCIVGILLFVLAVYFDIKAHSVNKNINNKLKIKSHKRRFKYKKIVRHTLKKGANL